MWSKNFTKEIFVIKCYIEVRYWCDACVNGVEDIDFCETKGNGYPLIPCAVQLFKEPTNVIYSDHWRWQPIINIEKGQITNWQQGVRASVYYKVCDGFDCLFVGLNDEVIAEYEGYVPSFMCPKEDGYGDYIIMDIDENGYIKNWDASKVKKFCDTEFC